MNVVLGISGGISVYKACDFVRLLRKNQHNVHVIMTDSAKEFVTPLTFQILSQNKVYSGMFTLTETDSDIEHITLAKLADIVIIAPATANVIGKIANGLSDDFLSTMIMATKAPVLICPAMNTVMFENRIVQNNLSILKKNGFHVLNPDSGKLACGDIGQGKLPEVSTIYQKMQEITSTKRDLTGKKLLITAGPTREFLDPVRFITNRSSGKMGYEIAEEATKRGAIVRVISGPVAISASHGFVVDKVQTADEMYDGVMSHVNDYDIVVFVAAVGDYSSKSIEKHKLSKVDEERTITLKRNRDIAKEVSMAFPDKFLVGFCAETQNLRDRAFHKLNEKKMDMIVANDVSLKNAGFEVDTNQVFLIDQFGQEEFLPLLSKKETANRILDRILKNLSQKQKNVL